MWTQTKRRRLCAGVLSILIWIALGGCDVLREPPAPEWPGPHAPYPFPDDIPHRTE
jgi:hypothetical protein